MFDLALALIIWVSVSVLLPISEKSKILSKLHSDPAHCSVMVMHSEIIYGTLNFTGADWNRW